MKKSPSVKRKPKILYWDVETSGIITTTWGLYPNSIPHDNIIQDWFMLSIAWKEEGGKMQSVSLLDDPKRFKRNPKDDYHVIKTLRDVLEDVDILVHQNGDKFDLRMFNTRLIHHKLSPLPKFQTIDTLKEVRKIARNTSNRLDYLGKWLFNAGKMETPKGTWLKAMQGDENALKVMVAYNKKDVALLEKVYKRLRPYFKNSPHIGALKGKDKDKSCPKCGSSNFVSSSRKVRYTAAGLPRIQLQCKSCHSYTTFRYKK